MRFGLSEEQTLLKDTIDRFLADRVLALPDVLVQGSQVSSNSSCKDALRLSCRVDLRLLLLPLWVEACVHELAQLLLVLVELPASQEECFLGIELPLLQAQDLDSFSSEEGEQRVDLLRLVSFELEDDHHRVEVDLRLPDVEGIQAVLHGLRQLAI